MLLRVSFAMIFDSKNRIRTIIGVAVVLPVELNIHMH